MLSSHPGPAMAAAHRKAGLLVERDIMEWVDVISQLVSNVGFPIACCGVLFYLAYKFGNSINSGIAQIQTSVDSIAKSIEKLADAVEDVRINIGNVDGGGQ